MSKPSYTTEFTVTESPERVYRAVASVRDWWTETIEGSTTDLGDEFVFSDAGIRFARFHIAEAVPGRRMVWEVRDSYLTFVDDHDEWTGTRVIFEVTESSGETTLHFTHEGLRPAVECYDACSRGWGACMHSIKKLITTGVSQTGPKK